MERFRGGRQPRRPAVNKVSAGTEARPSNLFMIYGWAEDHE
jgi:hypothetical protein